MSTFIKLLLMVTLSSFSQIFIKIGSREVITNSGFKILIKSFFNYYIILGVAFVVTAPLLYFSALSMVPLNMAYSINGLGYIFVIIMGRFILREYISIFHIAGGLLILGGFMVWNMGAGLY
jgi:drug/metabolite transporter (DMT)-like permease